MPATRTLVALATYNEVENLPRLVDEIERVLSEADVLVVDDNSPDGTGKWCDERARVDARLTVLHRAAKLGLGSATIAAMQFALDHTYDVLVTMDADWSHDPEYLPALVRTIDSADVAIGSRYCEGGVIEGWPLGRRVLSRGVNWLSGILLRLPVHDKSGAFRAYRTEVLRTVGLTNIRSAGYSYLEEILWHLNRIGATFAEVPITFRERRAGKSKISLKEAAAKARVLWTLSKTRADAVDLANSDSIP
jgi:dolichol-phosphate mannosyltransferase